MSRAKEYKSIVLASLVHDIGEFNNHWDCYI
jgi:hypothetical protein